MTIPERTGNQRSLPGLTFLRRPFPFSVPPTHAPLPSSEISVLRPRRYLDIRFPSILLALITVVPPGKRHLFRANVLWKRAHVFWTASILLPTYRRAICHIRGERVENLATDPKFRNLGRGINIKICIEAQGTGHGIDQRVLISGVGCSFFFFCLFFLPFFPAVARKQYSRVSGPISDWPARRWLRSIKRHDATLCASRDPFGGGVAYKLLPIDSTSAIVRRRCEQPAL